ncbi:MAG: hypothetical protein IJV04_00925 [Lachnospiraceae bacterium]|nr:hypothetical protein [Lachnospiraceae bacterium]
MRTLHFRLGVVVDITEDEEKAIFSSDSAAETIQNAMSRGGWRVSWDSYIPGPWIDVYNSTYGTNYPGEDLEIGFDEDDLMGNREFNFLTNFAGQSDMTQEINQDRLRMLWTSLVLHQDLTPNTAVYDTAIRYVWDRIEEKGAWDDFDSFVFYITRYLV